MSSTNINNRFNTAGYSLIEVMVAIMIIGISFISLVSAFPFALKIVNSAENRTRASYYAQEKIEELYQQGYDNIGVGIIETRTSLGATPPRSSFQRETTVEYIDGNLAVSGSDVGMKKITSRVYYTHAFKKDDTYFEASTIIADR